MRDFANLQADLLNRLGMRIAVAMLFAITLTWLGALHSKAYDVFSRLGYWTINLVVWAVLSAGCIGLIRSFSSLGRWQVVAAATLVASVPMLIVASSVTLAISGWASSPDEWLELLPSIWLIGGAQLAFCEALETPVARAITQSDTLPIVAGNGPENSNGLIDRLPPHLGLDIVCLHVEDHYVRVYTVHGSALILTRFADALRDVADIPGMRVHRSWWVASHAVDTFARIGRTGELRLANDVVVPISQPYLASAIGCWGNRLAAAT